jgi:hypothetical protein
MAAKFTRHGLAQVRYLNEVSLEGILPVPSSVQKTLEDLIRGFKPWEASPLDFELFEIARYLGEIDPLGIIDSEQERDSEYLLEAQSITWLFENQEFSINSFWAMWIYFFDEEISPFRSQVDELLVAMFAEISIILNSRPSKAECDELALKAQTPWLGAGIAAMKFQSSKQALIEKKRKKLRG